MCDVVKERCRFLVFFEVCALKKMELRLGAGGGAVGMRRGKKGGGGVKGRRKKVVGRRGIVVWANNLLSYDIWRCN